MELAIIGGGAAGCFCAVQFKRLRPDAGVTVFEAGERTLAKVAVTGGGRCNLTNSFEDISDLRQAYPRGHRLMKRALSAFSHEDCRDWFQAEGVALVLQEDRCVFPKSQDAMQIVRTLNSLMRRLGVTVHTSARVSSIEASADGGFLVNGERFDAVVVTTGGSPKAGGLKFLEPLGLELVAPVPSLFTLELEDRAFRSLMGTVVENATASLAGTAHSASGPLLVTDWGASGPAVIKLTSYAARDLAACGYKGTLNINWLGESSEEDARALLGRLVSANPQKLCSSTHPAELPSRLWEHLLAKAGLRGDLRWAEAGKKGLNRLAGTLICDSYSITGKGRFRDEFVTCGGVAISEVSMNTMESKKYPGLFFAGEVLDIDAITGGFNLQAAWSTGWVAAEGAAARFTE